MSMTSEITRFIFPPSKLDNRLDFSDVRVYYLGEDLIIHYTAPPIGIAISVLLWQANRTTGVLIGDQQYISQSVVNKSTAEWRSISTDFNLTLSNLCQLTLYIEGELEPVDFSQYLYLEENANAASGSMLLASSSLLSSSTTSATSFSFAAGSSTPTTLPTATQTSLSTHVPMPSTASHTGSFPKSAKIGVGIGIPVALLLGLIIGFLLFRRYKKEVAPPRTPSSPVAEQYKDGPYAPPLNEAPPESLVELDPQHAAGAHAHNPPEDRAAQARYEM
ncbi:hypothetical protein ACET3X_008509 [Alternaria dauci]|uniref:Mid2 domain-containing protein n=1 Tax=Alternaria dauci TaxID=48095 RepID=A0ABR3UBE8_9PLEO